MKLNRVLLLTAIFTILSSCAGSKINRILKQGSVLQENFKTTIPFVYVNGWIVLEVEIQNKKYNFILDTGSSNIITEDLAEELNIKLLGNEEVKDINGKVSNTRYTSIDNIKIGTIDFQETISGIVDLTKITEINCTKIDGLIGSNLMRKAVWDFDFQNRLITITNDEEKLDILTEKIIESKLFIGTAGIPSIIVDINGQKTLNNTVDLGNGGVNHLRVDYFKKQLKNERIKKHAKSKGKAWGLFGRTQSNTLHEVIIDEMQIGNHTTTNLFAQISNVSGNIGLSFFKNYRVILNWKTKRLKMIKIADAGKGNYKTYGFSVLHNKNNLFVNYITDFSSASKYLKNGDKILRINNIDYSSINKNEYCNFLTQEIIYKNTEPLLIAVSRKGKELDFELIKQNYFN